MAKETATVGTIGQMYQNRKKPEEIGVLESRDEKYKTLLFRDRDGKTFNIAYSSFRSSWRKYEGDEVIETSTQKEQKAAKKEEKTEQAKEKLAKKEVKQKTESRQRLSDEEKKKYIDDVCLTVEDAVNNHSHDMFVFEHTKNDCARIYHLDSVTGKREMFIDVWTLFTINLGKVRFYTKKDTFKEAVFSKAVGKIEAKISENPKERMPVSFVISTDLLSQAVADMLDSLAKTFADKEQEKEEKEKK